MNARTIVDDTPYYRSHMRQPRGRGSWAFADINDQHDINAARFFSGTFSQARKQAIASFPAGSIIVVLP